MTFRDFVSLYASVDALAASPQRASSTGLPILRHMPPLLPRKITQTRSVVFVWMHRPSPYVHRVGIFNLTFEATSGFTCVTACGFASGNPRPLITQTPLPLATGVHGQSPDGTLTRWIRLLLLRTDALNVLKLWQPNSELKILRASR